MYYKLTKLAKLVKKFSYKDYLLLIKLAEYTKEHREKIDQCHKNSLNPLKDLFPNGDRIYIDTALTNDEGYIDDEIELFFAENNIESINYLKGLIMVGGVKMRLGKYLNKYLRDSAKTETNEVKDYLKENKTDPVKLQIGLTGVVKTTENKLRFDEATELDKYIDENLNRNEQSRSDIIYYLEAHNAFANSVYRANGNAEKMIVIITKDPHDVGQMSTGRNWKSCMNLDGGQYRSNVYAEVEAGGAIAYLTTADDRNIENPLARIWIRMFANKDNIILKPEDTVYGTNKAGFRGVVEEWTKKASSAASGVYHRLGAEYSDSTDELFMNFKENNEVSGRIINYLKTNDDKELEKQIDSKAWTFTATYRFDMVARQILKKKGIDWRDSNVGVRKNITLKTKKDVQNLINKPDNKLLKLKEEYDLTDDEFQQIKETRWLITSNMLNSKYVLEQSIEILQKTKPNITKEDLDDITNANPKLLKTFMNKFEDQYSIAEKAKEGFFVVIGSKGKIEIRKIIDELIKESINTSDKRQYLNIMRNAVRIAAKYYYNKIDYVVDMYDFEKCNKEGLLPLIDNLYNLIYRANDQNKVALKIADAVMQSALLDKITPLKNISYQLTDPQTLKTVRNMIEDLSKDNNLQ